jgi:hypothetical protein
MAALAAEAMASPVVVLYWDGTQFESIGPGAVAEIPAGAKYALDEVRWTGIEVILAAMPGTPSPDPNTVPGPSASVPSITTPSGVTFEIPDAGNVSSVTQDGGSVTVTYVDGATATVPGTYVPPGSAPPAPPAPPNDPVGPPAPPLNPGQQAAVDDDLIDSSWVNDYLGGPPDPSDLPPPGYPGSFDSIAPPVIDSVYINSGTTDTIVQRTTDPTKTPESGTGIMLLLGVAAWGGAMTLRGRRASSARRMRA